MKTKKFLIIMSVLMILSLDTYSNIYDTLCNPNPSKEAVALYRYILDMDGKKIFSGQMWAPWGINEIDYVEGITGKKPAIAGVDFIDESANNGEVQKAIDYWNNGGIPTIMWHWGAPGVGEGYQASQVPIEISQCFIPGTDEYNDFWFELDRKADQLEKLRDANVPVLWRPFHELDGGWFWWGAQGPENFKLLWTTMYNYFVNDRGLNNLIWVLCYTNNDPTIDWFPGNEYVDIIGGDTYEQYTGANAEMYENIFEAVDTNYYPYCFHECGAIPNPDWCLEEEVMWSWWMVWHTFHIQNINEVYLNQVYDHDIVITLNEVPDIDSVYGWDSDCNPAVITPYLKIDTGDWQQTNNVGVHANSGALITFSPQVEEAGTWNWSGCGLSDTSREQTVSANQICTATATFLNECGATSTQTFNIYNDCTPTTLIPYLQVDGGEWQDTSRVTVDIGASVTFSPQADTNGTWSWGGCDTSFTTQEFTLIAEDRCNIRGVYTNYCGKTSDITLRILLNEVSGISNSFNDLTVSIYPLPCKDNLNIEFNWSQTNASLVNVYSIEGNLAMREIIKSDNVILNTSHLVPNMYIIKIKNKDFEITEKFFKIE